MVPRSIAAQDANFVEPVMQGQIGGAEMGRDSGRWNDSEVSYAKQRGGGRVEFESVSQ